MSVFTFKIRDIYQLTDLQDKELDFICLEFNKVVNSYAIKTDLYSQKVWNYITEKFQIKDESDVMTSTEIEMDEKNKKHKLFKYIVKCNIDDFFIFMVFNDELRGWEDTDYHGYVTEEDKCNKIYNLTIYYDKEKISTKELDETIIKELLDCSYLPSTKNQFFTIATNQFGFTLKPSYIKDMEIDLELNYGKKFIPIHEKMLEKLETQNHGLFLLHGDPGTGKCVDGETFITLRDKTTGEIKEITIDEFNKLDM